MPTADDPRAEMLVETEWLADHLDDPGLRLLDAGQTIEAYNRAHLPGAVAWPEHRYVKDPADDLHVMPAERFAAVMSGLGVGNDTEVVLYDDYWGLYAARLWLVLRYYGHPRARVLNGGWNRWLSEGRPVSSARAGPAPARFTPRPGDASLICDLATVRAGLHDPGVVILDQRADDEWRGENDRGNPRVGAIPGAVHLEWLHFVTQDERRVFRPAEEMWAVLASAGITPGHTVLTYCQSGIRAAHGTFVLRLLGFGARARCYDGSMAEWSRHPGAPLVRPAPGASRAPAG